MEVSEQNKYKQMQSKIIELIQHQFMESRHL